MPNRGGGRSGFMYLPADNNFVKDRDAAGAEFETYVRVRDFHNCAGYVVPSSQPQRNGFTQRDLPTEYGELVHGSSLVITFA
jgi:hypothetical protein